MKQAENCLFSSSLWTFYGLLDFLILLLIPKQLIWRHCFLTHYTHWMWVLVAFLIGIISPIFFKTSVSLHSPFCWQKLTFYVDLHVFRRGFFFTVVLWRHLAISSLTSGRRKCVHSETAPSRFDPEGKQSSHHSIFILGHISRILCLVINLKFNMKGLAFFFLCAPDNQHIHPPLVPSVCMSAAAYSPLCRFRVISMRCRNVQISSFGVQHIRQDYPQAGWARLLAGSFLLPRLIGLTRALHIWPRNFSRLFLTITST